MKTPVLALVGDRSEGVRAHRAIPLAREKFLATGGAAFELRWQATGEPGLPDGSALADCAGVWCVPGSPYASMDGALGAIRFARERGVPFLGTCGGCQHAIIEFARNVAGLTDADHAESNPDAATIVIEKLACSLVGETRALTVRPGSKLFAAVGAKSVEKYHCSYGPGHGHAELYRDRALRVTAVDEDGQPRAFELAAHPWFVATLFQPELRALDGELHPLLAAFFRRVAGGGSRRPRPGGERDEGVPTPVRAVLAGGNPAACGVVRARTVSFSPAMRLLRPALVVALAAALTVPGFAADAADSPALQAAIAHYTARRDAEAKTAFEAIVQADAKNVAAQHYLARLAKRARDWAKYVELMELCTKLDPKNPELWSDLGEAYGRLAAKGSKFSALGNAKKSRAALEKAVELAPDDLRHRFGLIAFLLEAPGIAGGSVKDARTQAGEIARRDPYSGEMARAQIAMHEEDWIEAEKSFRVAARLKPAAVDPRFALGQLLADRSRYEESFTVFEELLQQNPQNWAALYQIGRTAALSGLRLERGEAALNQYLVQAPRTPGLPTVAQSRFRLGQIFVKKGANEAAKLQFEEAIKEDPKLEDAAKALKKLS